jgi:hypothetical protein
MEKKRRNVSMKLGKGPFFSLSQQSHNQPFNVYHYRSVVIRRMASKLSLRDKFKLACPPSAVVGAAKRSNLADTFSISKSVDDSEEVDVKLSKDSTDIAATTADDIAATADCDDLDMQNNMLFDYMYGSSPESTDGNDSRDSSDSEDDNDQYAIAPDP